MYISSHHRYWERLWHFRVVWVRELGTNTMASGAARTLAPGAGRRAALRHTCIHHVPQEISLTRFFTTRAHCIVEVSVMRGDMHIMRMHEE